MSVLNAVYKQVSVDSEMCSDIGTAGRSVQSLFYFFNGLYKILVICKEASGNSKMYHCFF